MKIKYLIGGIFLTIGLELVYNNIFTLVEDIVMNYTSSDFIWGIWCWTKTDLFTPILEETLRLYDSFLGFPYFSFGLIGKELIESSNLFIYLTTFEFVYTLISKMIVHLGLFSISLKHGFRYAVLIHAMLNTSVTLIRNFYWFNNTPEMVGTEIGMFTLTGYCAYELFKYCKTKKGEMIYVYGN